MLGSQLDQIIIRGSPFLSQTFVLSSSVHYITRISCMNREIFSIVHLRVQQRPSSSSSRYVRVLISRWARTSYLNLCLTYFARTFTSRFHSLHVYELFHSKHECKLHTYLYMFVRFHAVLFK